MRPVQNIVTIKTGMRATPHILLEFLTPQPHVQTPCHGMQVATHLMTKNDEYTSHAAALEAANRDLTVHNSTLSVNLTNSARVIEQVMELNEEVASKLNTLSAHLERQQAAAAQRPAAHTGSPEPLSTDFDNSEAGAAAIDLPTARPAVSWQPPPPAAPRAAQPAAASSTRASWGQPATGPGMPAVLRVPQAAEPAAGPSKRAPPKLADAFAAFLEEPAMAEPATAASLAIPMGAAGASASMGSAPQARGLLRWWLGRGDPSADKFTHDDAGDSVV